jgi:hypothetical protein
VLLKTIFFAEEMAFAVAKKCKSMRSTSTHVAREPHNFFSGRMSGVGGGKM